MTRFIFPHDTFLFPVIKEKCDFGRPLIPIHATLFKQRNFCYWEQSSKRVDSVLNGAHLTILFLFCLSTNENLEYNSRHPLRFICCSEGRGIRHLLTIFQSVTTNIPALQSNHDVRLLKRDSYLIILIRAMTFG